MNRSTSIINFFGVLALGIGATMTTSWILEPETKPSLELRIAADPIDLQVQNELRRMEQRLQRQQRQMNEQMILANPVPMDFSR